MNLFVPLRWEGKSRTTTFYYKYWKAKAKKKSIGNKMWGT